MAITRENTIRKFQKVAVRRLEAAIFLKETEFRAEAVYIAGYSAECALKALILQHSPKREFRATLSLLTEVGAKGHRFEYLRNLYKRRRFGLPLTGEVHLPKDSAVFPTEVSAALWRVAIWETSLRYELAFVEYEDTDAFVKAVRVVRNWAARG